MKQTKTAVAHNEVSIKSDERKNLDSPSEMKENLSIKAVEYTVAFIENLEWLTCVDAAVYLRKFRRRDGKPSVGAIRNLIYRGKLKARKFGKVIYLKKSEIDRALELSII